MEGSDDGARSVRKGSFGVARYVWRTSPGWALALGSIIAGAAALSVAFTIATGIVVGSVPGTLVGGLSSPAGDRLLLAVTAAAAAFVIQQVLGPVKDALAEKVGRLVDGRIRHQIMEATLRPTGMDHLEDPRTLDRISLVQGVGLAHFTPGDAVIGLAENLGSYLVMIGGAVLVATFNPLLSAWLVASNLFARSRLLRETSKRVEVVTGQSQMLRRSNYYRDLALTPEAAKETRIFGMGDWISERFRSGSHDVLSKMWAERKNVGRLPLLWFAPGAVAMLTSFYLLGRATIDGTIGLSEMAVVAQAVLTAGTWFVSDSDLLIQYGGAAIDPTLEVVEEVSATAGPTGEGTDVPGGPIAFEHVSFGYPGRDDLAFEDLNLRIEPGRSLAIVGRNGAGKTTLVKLLCRMYDPISGSVTAGGVDLRSLDPRTWRRKVSAIFQDFVRYEMPARANVGFGAVRMMDDLSALEHAARRSGILNAVEAAPRGWETILSREYSGGVDLSGGQWQRVALARALLAVDGGAQVLILDEPTANLDVRAEAELFDEILRQVRGTTTILISHRFSTVRKADLICVLDGGRVVELGTHDQLLAGDGLYASMFRTQAAPYAAASGSGPGAIDG